MGSSSFAGATLKSGVSVLSPEMKSYFDLELANGKRVICGGDLSTKTNFEYSVIEHPTELDRKSARIFGKNEVWQEAKRRAALMPQSQTASDSFVYIRKKDGRFVSCTISWSISIPSCFRYDPAASVLKGRMKGLTTGDALAIIDTMQRFQKKAYRKRKRTLDRLLKDFIPSQVFETLRVSSRFLQKLHVKGRCRKQERTKPIENSQKLASMFLPGACPDLLVTARAADINMQSSMAAADHVRLVKLLGLRNDPLRPDIILNIGSGMYAVMDLHVIKTPKGPSIVIGK